MELSEQFKQAKKELEKDFNQFKKSERKCTKLNFKIEFPKLKSKYEGKYFKGENQMQDKKWEVFVHCIEIASAKTAICTSFEITPWNQFNLHPRSEQMLDYCQEEISEEAYLREMREFIEKVNQH